MSKSDIWMPLFIGDYLADTMHLEAREHGAYLLALMHYWRHGPLPDDDRALAGICRVDRKTWLDDTGPIVRAFFEARDGRLHQKRADFELEKMGNISEKRRAAALKRHGGGSNSGGNGPASPQHARSKRRANASGLHDDSRARTSTFTVRSTSDASASEDATPRSAERPTRGTRLPDDWKPSTEERAYASGLGLDADVVAANFADYWHARAGREARKARWDLTWRVWCRNEKRPARDGPLNGHRRPARNGAIEILIQARERAALTGATLLDTLPDE